MTALVLLLFLLLLILLVLLLSAYFYAINSKYRISSAEAKRRIHEFDLILDVRTDLERSTLGFYPGSVHIPSADLERRMPAYPDKDIRILAYCNSGQRARAATEKLHKLGYRNAVYIATTYQSLL